MYNPYNILGVQDNTSIEECKKAYKKLAIKYHPDKGGNAEEFCKITSALNSIRGGFIIKVKVTKKVRHINIMALTVVA